MRDFVHPVHSHAKQGFVLVHPVRGIKEVGLCPFGTKLLERMACLYVLLSLEMMSESMAWFWIRLSSSGVKGLSPNKLFVPEEPSPVGFQCRTCYDGEASSLYRGVPYMLHGLGNYEPPAMELWLCRSCMVDSIASM